MSRIYFHSPSNDAEVRGWERAHASWLCEQVFRVSLHLDALYASNDRPAIVRAFPAGHYIHRSRATGKDLVEEISHALHGMSGEKLIIGDATEEIFLLSLNTAWAMGSDPMRLLARLHGQCELHCYVEGKNRNWLAGIIEDGRKYGIMRANSGWEDVVSLLRSRDDEPVVTSYSVCEQFPNQSTANASIEDDAWYELPGDKQWEMAMSGLRSGSMGDGLEMNPDTWGSFYFGSGLTGFDVVNSLKDTE